MSGGGTRNKCTRDQFEHPLGPEATEDIRERYKDAVVFFKQENEALRELLQKANMALNLLKKCTETTDPETMADEILKAVPEQMKELMRHAADSESDARDYENKVLALRQVLTQLHNEFTFSVDAKTSFNTATAITEALKEAEASKRNEIGKLQKELAAAKTEIDRQKKLIDQHKARTTYMTETTNQKLHLKDLECTKKTIDLLEENTKLRTRLEECTNAAEITDGGTSTPPTAASNHKHTENVETLKRRIELLEMQILVCKANKPAGGKLDQAMDTAAMMHELQTKLNNSEKRARMLKEENDRKSKCIENLQNIVKSQQNLIENMVQRSQIENNTALLQIGSLLHSQEDDPDPDIRQKLDTLINLIQSDIPRINQFLELLRSNQDLIRVHMPSPNPYSNGTHCQTLVVHNQKRLHAIAYPEDSYAGAVLKMQKTQPLLTAPERSPTHGYGLRSKDKHEDALARELAASTASVARPEVSIRERFDTAETTVSDASILNALFNCPSTARQGDPTARQGGPIASQGGPTARQGGPSTSQRGPTASQRGPTASQRGSHTADSAVSAILSDPAFTAAISFLASGCASKPNPNPGSNSTNQRPSMLSQMFIPAEPDLTPNPRFERLDHDTT